MAAYYSFLLTNWKHNSTRMFNYGNDRVYFITDSKDKPDMVLAHDGQHSGKKRGFKFHPLITCHRCGKTGHFASNCESEKPVSSESLMIARITKPMTMIIIPKISCLLMAGIADGDFDSNEHAAFRFL
jgi:hypothetical protein